MQLDHIPLDQLKPSVLNVRKTGGKEVGDLIASIRSLGLLQPLLVRRNCEGFDIIAGQRRYAALSALAADGAYADTVPCLVMEAGDDARAIEASLAENIARLPMDEVDQYEAFAALRAEGVSASDIAARFGVTERLVEQRLAIANLIPSILKAYRRSDLTAETLRILTMATVKQQKAWWKLFKNPEEYAPTGRGLRSWLFGGVQVPVSNALFDLAAYPGAIVSDLFGEESYFADITAFWTLQDAAIAERRAAYLDAGWREAVLLERGQHFAAWNHVRTPKTKGGRVYIAVSSSGEVTFHEGWLTEKEAKQRAKADSREEADAEDEGTNTPPAAPERSELTAALRNYLALHRHAAVRTELLAQSGLALRLAVAHIVAGSPLWKVEAEPQRADNEAIAASLAGAKAQAGFAAERAQVRALLGWSAAVEDGEDGASVVPSRHDFGMRPGIAALWERLVALEERDVLRILAFVMAESLAVSSPLVDLIGTHMGTDMRLWWQPDETFLALLRDKQALNAMLREVAGDVTADAHRASTAKVQKKIIADCLKGEGRPKAEGWLPRYMGFPAESYLGRAVDTRTVLSGDDEATSGDAPGDADDNQTEIDERGSDDEDDVADAA